MKKRDRKAFGNYVRHMANEMGLRDWVIDVYYSDDDAAGDANKIGSRETTWTAINFCPPHQKVCALTFRSDIADYDLDQLRALVCHELVHCHFAPMVDLVRHDVDGQLSKQAYELFSHGFTRQMEWAVDGIAAEWCRHFPLIKWPKEKKGKHA